MDLTGKQAAFVEAYIQTWNATEAARRAGYAGSDNTLGVTGFQNLRNPKIRAAVEARLRENSITTDEITARLWAIASADLGNLTPALVYSSPVEILETAEALGLSFLIKKIRQTKEGVEVTLHDSLRALDILARHMLPTKAEVKTEVPGTSRLDAELEKLTFEQLAAIADAEIERQAEGPE